MRGGCALTICYDASLIFLPPQLLLPDDINCLVIKSSGSDAGKSSYVGLFDVRSSQISLITPYQPSATQYSDVNAFLTLAATRRTVEDFPDDDRANEIIAAARAGRVPVRLVSSGSFRMFLFIIIF